MSLKIYHGSRIEDLAEKLVGELKAERAAKGPFEFLNIAVANPNLGNWLKMTVLAKRPELSAGIEMPFLDDRLAELLKANYRGTLELISGRDYPAFILDVLMNQWRGEFLPFLKYIKDDQDVAGSLTIETQREARKAVQLADKLAHLIDAYEATGYLGLLGENKGKNEVYRGEQALVETLFGKGDAKGSLEEKGKISLRQMFDEVKKEEPKDGTERILLFGQVELTDIQIDILAWLAQKYEILWYFPEDVEQSCGVASWAAAKKKTIGAVKGRLGAYVAFEPVKAKEPDREKPSVLYALQSGKAALGLEQDASVQIVGAPGIRREVEMVYNAILGAVWEKNADGKPMPKKGMSFSDIAVLVPDMPTYRPMIEAVFDGRGQIPYGLVDATTPDYSTYLDGFLALMDIARYGLSRKRIFIALENPCVQRAMGFTRDDVVKWRELAEDFGAYEGYKEADSDEKNVSGYFNWEWALRRMRLGLVAQDVGVEKGGADKLPLEARDADVVYKFSEVVETLYRKLSALSRMPKADCSSKDEKEWPDTWAGRIHAVMDEFLAVDKDDDLEPLVRARIVKTLNGLTMIKGPQSFKLPVAMVEHCVAGTECAKGGYLRHGVTIGGLRSLAHVPFKQIFVLGLGEGGLPGRNDCSTLDVRNELKVEERGDVLRPEESRARFLAAVLSARDRLVLSYPNRELGSDAKLYPSSVVNDLKGALSKVISGDFKEFEGYPLTEFAEKIQTPDGQVRSAISREPEEDCFKGLLPSRSKKAYVLAGYAVGDAKKIEDNGADKDEVAKVEEAPKTDTAEKNELAEPTPKDLAEFVKDPFTAILKRRLGIAVEGYRDKTLEEASPLGVSKGPALWDLQKEIVLKHFGTVFDRKQIESCVPTEFLGDFAKGKLADVVQFWETTESVSDRDRAILESGQSDDDLSVVCKPFSDGTEAEPISLPPDAVLLPLFEFLKKHKDVDVKTKTKYEFKVKVLDVANGGTYKKGERKDLPKGIGCWKYNLDFADPQVAGYYDAVAAEYKRFVVAWDDGGEYPSVTYDELREQLKTKAKLGAVSWNQIASEIVRERNESQQQGSSFNSNLVVSRVTDVFKRDPYGADIERFFKKLFWLPMSVENELSAINGGAR